MDAEFDLSKFDHYPSYDPGTGACKSYLVSLEAQQVRVGMHMVDLKLHETIYMEISQKYSLDDIEKLALQSGFEPIGRFTDRKGWFADCLWQA